MKNICIKTIACCLLFAGSVYAQEFSMANNSGNNTRNMLESSWNLDNNDVERIIELLDQKITTDKGLSSNNEQSKKIHSIEMFHLI